MDDIIGVGGTESLKADLFAVQQLILKLSEDEQRELYRWMHRELNVFD